MSRFLRAVSTTRRAWHVMRASGRAFELAVAGIAAYAIAVIILPGVSMITSIPGQLPEAIAYVVLILLQLLVSLHGLLLRAAGVTLRHTWPLLVASSVLACTGVAAIYDVLAPAGTIGMTAILLLLLVDSPRVWIAYLACWGLIAAVVLLLLPPSAASFPSPTTQVYSTIIYVVGGIAMRSMRWLVVNTAQLAEAKAEIAWLTVTRERDRISQDLHDRLGQDLVSIVMRTELAERLVTAAPDRSARESRAAHQVARRALQEMRNIAHGTLVADLDAELTAAVELLDSRGATCRLRVGEYPQGTAAEVLAWVLRESVTNVLRHSEPSVCTVELVRDGDRFKFLIENDGVTGKDATAPGRGLTGIADRVRRAGGTVDAEFTGDRFRLAVTLMATPDRPA
ncbi:sensor histidine kinase [Amycolatopsis lurida]